MDQTLPSENGFAYTADDLEKLDPCNVPAHIALMMDGNRRWAKSHNLPIPMGYIAGAEALTKVVKACSKLGVKTVTAYSFSTENWTRPEEEVENLMELFQAYLIKQRLPMKADGVRFDTIGDLSRLPSQLQNEVQSTKDFTSDCNTIKLVLALNYGGRDEICRAVNKIVDNPPKERITEAYFQKYLDTSRYPDPELLIRTSGEMRLSNFLLWQISYAEVYVTKQYWPDFSEQSLLEAIIEYQMRKRRCGGS